MKSLKKMLLGIALLIISLCGLVVWLAGAGIGAVVFFVFLLVGGFLCVDGYLTPQ